MNGQNSTVSEGKGHRNLLILLFVGFVPVGIATVIVGPLLPMFIQKWSLDDRQAGFFFTVQFTAAMIGVGLSSALSAWRGYRPALILGYALTAAGLAGLNTGSHLFALAATASFGCGYGLVIPGTNLLVAEAGGKRSASLLNFLNFTWGVGAIACSPLVLLALKHMRLPGLLIGLGISGGLMTLGMALASFEGENPRESTNASASRVVDVGRAVTIALAALFFIYVGMETSVGGWSAEIAKRLAKGSSGITTLTPMFFYAGLTSGRALAPLVLLRVNERRLVLGALVLAASGTSIVMASNTFNTAILGVFLAGLGCASIYPIYIAWLSKWYGTRTKRVGGVLFALASLGGAAGPWLVGAVSKYSGNLRLGLLVPFASAIIMIWLVLLLRRQTAA
jgi:FHS family glucose/mannose:H+ symporter-like MFS transporter